MALTLLPKELFDGIISHVLPEGFESLALTCKSIYELCKPSIERHNRLRCEYQKFKYREFPNGGPAVSIKTAFELIKRIAIEPILARYIEEADFVRDSHPPRSRYHQSVPDVDRGGPVVTLFASSPYLKRAGLDWKEYYAVIEDDLKRNDYSQHAAAFVLTLLPNIKTLMLPREWKPLDAPNKLIDAIVRGTKQSNLPIDRPSLAQVTKFGLSVALACPDLECSIRFLALPRMLSFRGPSFVALGNGHMSVASKDPYRCLGETLQTVYLEGCCIDEVGIADFLKHTPHLRTLEYSHSTSRVNSPQDWNICKFVAAIEREVGSHLIELSISIRRLSGSLIPGKASMRGFARLQRLELPLEIAICGVSAAVCEAGRPAEFQDGGTELECPGPFISDLVPASLSQLWLISDGTVHHGKTLALLFRQFAKKKESQMPALKEIHLSCRATADKSYRDEYDKLLTETEKMGVVLKLVLCSVSASLAMEWEGKWERIIFSQIGLKAKKS